MKRLGWKISRLREALFRLDSKALTFDKLSDKLMGMKTNVSTLLRDFPRVRRTVLSGEDVWVKTREGTLRITADKPAGSLVLGRCRDLLVRTDDDIDEPSTTPEEWAKRK